MARYNCTVRRFLRILFNAATVLSLVLCVATAALWVRSYWRLDTFAWTRPPRPGAESLFVYLDSGSGGMMTGIGLLSYGWASEQPSGWDWRRDDHRPVSYAGGRTANRWGFGHDSFHHPQVRWVRIIVPAWLVVTLFGALPTTRLALSIRRRRRSVKGRCLRCGYDLRATPDRCPECGATPTPARSP
jgi:hypothetical protein